MTMKAYKALTNFTVEKAQAVAAFRTSKDFYDDCIKFNEEAFQEGHKLGQANYRLRVIT